MNNPIFVAVDAMGGDNSPNKVIKGIEIHNSTTENVYYNIFGNKNDTPLAVSTPVQCTLIVYKNIQF